MTLEHAQTFAAEWVAARNRHGADDFPTPMIQQLLGIVYGKRQGKRAVGD